MRKTDGVNQRPTHILLIEDNPGDARILRELLAEGQADRFTLTHVDRLESGIRCLNQRAVDVILLDLSLPDSQGAETLCRMHAAAKGVPIVLMTGLEDEELGLRLIQAGAQDYLVKGQVTAPLLTRALSYAVERSRLERELREKTRLLQSVLHSIADGVVMADEAGMFQVWNPAAERIMGTGPIRYRNRRMVRALRTFFTRQDDALPDSRPTAGAGNQGRIRHEHLTISP